MAHHRAPLALAAASLAALALAGCGTQSDGAGPPADANALGFDPTAVEVPEFAPRDSGTTPAFQSGFATRPMAPPVVLASGPDVCFRRIADRFGADLKVAEITSFFSAGADISDRSAMPRGQMTTCSVMFQDPDDPRKLKGAQYDFQSGQFGEPRPVEIRVIGMDPARFRVSDHVIPLAQVNAAALTGVMRAQDQRLRSVYGDYAWTGVRLEAPDAFSSTHTLRLDLEGRIAANDLKGSGYASVSTDGKRVTRNHLMP